MLILSLACGVEVITVMVAPHGQAWFLLLGRYVTAHCTLGRSEQHRAQLLPLPLACSVANGLKGLSWMAVGSTRHVHMAGAPCCVHPSRLIL
jgi:hypothetical protein